MISKRLTSYMTQILLVWCTLFAVLAIITVQGLDWEAKVPIPSKEIPVQTAAVPPPLPPKVLTKPAPAPYSLLPVGKEQGQGSLGNFSFSWNREKAQLSLAIPYTGTLGAYTTFRFDRVKALVFDLHGQWQAQATTMVIPAKDCPVRRIQLGQHGSYVRFSLVGNYETESEVRYTKDQLTIVLSGVRAKADTSGTRAGK